MKAEKKRRKLASVWWCRLCKLRFVLNGLPKSCTCDLCGTKLQFIDTLGPTRAPET